jgi:putative CocE/NonD family hydrolase
MSSSGLERQRSAKMSETFLQIEKQQILFGEYQGPTPICRGRTTQSVYIPMRDGVRLAAEVVLPKGIPAGAKIPALLAQTRYWRSFELKGPLKRLIAPEAIDPHFRGFRPFFTSHGYALIIVDVRGTGASFGTWPHPWHRDSIEDGRDIVDWIIAQPWSSGRVGAYGISYLGTTAELLMVHNHEAVKAVIPMFSHPDGYLDRAFPGGIFDDRFIKVWSDMDESLDANIVPSEFGTLAGIFVKGVKPVDDDGRQLLEAAVREHAANSNTYRLAQAITYRDEPHPEVAYCVDDATVHQFKEEIAHSNTVTCGWGSWMDSATADAVLRRFLTFDNAQMAVIGAWEHGGRFNASPYRAKDALGNPPLSGQWQEMLRFFDAYLKDIDNGVRDQKKLFYYTMGEEKWKKTDIWPPQGTLMQVWYLTEDRTLSPEMPQANSGADAYKVDFEASTGECNRWWEMAVRENKSVTYPDRAREDQRLLTYTSPPLDQDMEITGYPVITLYVTSTETDGAFFVYLEDVDEAGRVTYVTEGQLRAIHRKVSSETSPYNLLVPYHSFKMEDGMMLVPGEITQITFGLHPTSVLIKKGHCIRISIAGHDQGTFTRIPAQGFPEITVARNRNHASFVELPVRQNIL